MRALPLLLAWLPAVAVAHPMGTLSTNRSAILDLRPDVTVLHYTVEFAEVPSTHEFARVTALGDAFPVTRMGELLPGLSLRVDGTARTLTVNRCFESTVAGDGGLPTVSLLCELRGEPIRTGEVTFDDSNFAGTPGWREVTIVADGKVPLPFSSDPEAMNRRSGSASVAGLSHLMEDDVSVFGFAALLSAFVLGAAHALAPGHGKTLVAAWLVGSRGTIPQAVLLGLIVTLTHVTGVLILGGVALYLAEHVLAEALYPWIGVSSGVGVTALGAILLGSRWNAAPHAHAHPHPPPEGSGSLASLVAVGVSGGIVPCPSALVVLMSALALHRLVFGLALIGSFSAGLAAVLIGVGALVVRSRGWLDSFATAERATRWIPVASAVVVIVLGVGIAVQSALEGGLF